VRFFFSCALFVPRTTFQHSSRSILSAHHAAFAYTSQLHTRQENRSLRIGEPQESLIEYLRKSHLDAITMIGFAMRQEHRQ